MCFSPPLWQYLDVFYLHDGSAARVESVLCVATLDGFHKKQALRECASSVVEWNKPLPGQAQCTLLFLMWKEQWLFSFSGSSKLYYYFTVRTALSYSSGSCANTIWIKLSMTVTAVQTQPWHSHPWHTRNRCEDFIVHGNVASHQKH